MAYPLSGSGSAAIAISDLRPVWLYIPFHQVWHSSSRPKSLFLIFLAIVGARVL